MHNTLLSNLLMQVQIHHLPHCKVLCNTHSTKNDTCTATNMLSTWNKTKQLLKVCESCHVNQNNRFMYADSFPHKLQTLHLSISICTQGHQRQISLLKLKNLRMILLISHEQKRRSKLGRVRKVGRNGILTYR